MIVFCEGVVADIFLVGVFAETGEECVAGSSAGGGLDVMLFEEAALGEEFFDIGGVDVVFSEGGEFGAEVINADQEDVCAAARRRLLFGVKVGCQEGEE